MGGLGVRLASHFNKAAQTKLGWICLTNTSNWWAQIVKRNNLQKENFLALKKKSSHSSTWQAILDARNVLNMRIKWIVGNGKDFKSETTYIASFPRLILSVPYAILTGKPLLTYSQLVPFLKVFEVVLAWTLQSLLQILTLSPGWIWEMRNYLIFKDINPHPVRVLTVAGQVGFDYWHQNCKNAEGPKTPLHIKWKPAPPSPHTTPPYPPPPPPPPPPPKKKSGWVKLNFDGSVHNGSAATGFVIRDSDDHILLVGAKNIDSLAYVAHRGWHKVLVEGDSKLIIDCVNQKALAHHVFREANFTADAVASSSHGLNPSKL
ncbi:unnamed protein product [Prunus armeniaca]